MAVREGPLWPHQHPPCHYVEPMLPHEVHRLPNKVNTHNRVGHRLHLQPNRLALPISPHGHRVARNLREIAAVYAESETVGSKSAVLVKSWNGPLVELDDRQLLGGHHFLRRGRVAVLVVATGVVRSQIVAWADALPVRVRFGAEEAALQG